MLIIADSPVAARRRCAHIKNYLLADFLMKKVVVTGVEVISPIVKSVDEFYAGLELINPGLELRATLIY
jgi:hypothetical protein